MDRTRRILVPRAADHRVQPAGGARLVALLFSCGRAYTETRNNGVVVLRCRPVFEANPREAAWDIRENWFNPHEYSTDAHSLW